MPRVRRVLHASPGKSTIDILRLSTDELGWKLVGGPRRHDVDLYFVSSRDELEECLKVLRPGQLVSKLPGAHEVCAKLAFSALLGVAARLHPERFGFWPRTWRLPDESSDLAAFLAPEHRGAKRWVIVKPDDGSQGDGIFLSRSMTDVMSRLAHRPSQQVAVQEYLSCLLLGGCKWDARIYVLVTSVDPLECYVSHEGLARFCVESYCPPTDSNARSVCAHLTNYSLNKLHAHFEHNNDPDNGLSGTKRSLSAVLRELAKASSESATELPTKSSAPPRFNEAEFWFRVHRLVGASMAALLPTLRERFVAAQRRASSLGPGEAANVTARTAFHIFGFDILLDAAGEPRLLEVNANPSLAVDTIVPLSAEAVLEAGGIAALRKQRRATSGAASSSGAAPPTPFCECMSGGGRPHVHEQCAVDVHVKGKVVTSALRLATRRSRDASTGTPVTRMCSPFTPLNKAAADLNDFDLMERVEREMRIASGGKSMVSASAFSRWVRDAHLHDLGLHPMQHHVLFAQECSRASGGQVGFVQWVDLLAAVGACCANTVLEKPHVLAGGRAPQQTTAEGINQGDEQTSIAEQVASHTLLPTALKTHVELALQLAGQRKALRERAKLPLEQRVDALLEPQMSRRITASQSDGTAARAPAPPGASRRPRRSQAIIR
mmetsp:Transcript_6950/g.18901  ORF Transcript_6950/g.18901 Transcript_6950/m.18901 type:complete len:663 (-) Transcript_6950:71-2059(-)